MRKKLFFLALVLLGLCGSVNAYEVKWVEKPDKILIGQPLHLVFNVGTSDLEGAGGQLLQLIVTDQDLEVFAHYAPRLDASGNFTQDVVFPAEGRYILFFCFKPVLETPVALRAVMDAGKVKNPFPTVRMYFDTEKLTDDLMRAAFVTQPEEPVAGQETLITYTFAEAKTGKPVQNLQDCLGNGGSLVAINANGQTLSRSLTLENIGAADPAKALYGPQLNFKITFPQKGIYKMWGEFRRRNQTVVIPFMLMVK